MKRLKFLASVLLLMCAVSAAAQTVTVVTVPTGSNNAAIQAIFDNNPNATILFENGSYTSNGSIILTDATTPRNFQGRILGRNATITFTNAGSSTDPDIAMQRGFASYARTNGAGGDSTGLGDTFVIDGLNITGPLNGASFYSANSTAITFNRGLYSKNRYGIVLEASIQAAIRHIQFDDNVNAGIGLLFLADYARVWYGSPNSPSSWQDSPIIEDCKFTSSTGRSKMAAILDHGSNSEAIRHIRNNVSLGHPYFYLGRGANPTIGPNNWTEDDDYAVRLLTTNQSLGAEVNITGITASQPNGTYARTNFPDSYSFTVRVEGNHFVRCIDNLNLQGVSGGTGIIGGNVFSGLSGYHLVLTESVGLIVNLGESNITNPGTIPKFVAYPNTYKDLTGMAAIASPIFEGLVTLTGTLGSLQLKPRDGTGTDFTWHNPTGDDLQLDVSNVGTVFTATASGNVKITGDMQIPAQGKGVVLRATDGGNCFRLTVNSLGTLTATATTCP